MMGGLAFLGVGLALLLMGIFLKVGTELMMPVAGISIGACLMVVGFLFFGLNMRKQASEKQR
jgi:hypothetical protein